MNWPHPCTLSVTALVSDNSWSLHQDISRPPGNNLLTSIHTCGILHPPLVHKIDGNQYRIVCGANRLAAAVQLGETTINCLILDPALTDQELLQIVARDQAETGPLSPIETARLVKHAQQINGTHCVDLIRPFTNGRNRGHIERLVRLLDLEPSVRSAIHDGQIADRTGLILVSLSTADRLYLCDLFTNLQVSANKQQRIIELSRIIVAQEKITFRDMMTSRYNYCRFDRTIDNPPQIVSRLLNDLYRDSHPLSSQAQQSFNERVDALKLPPHCQVSPTVSFENDRVTVAVELSSINELEKMWPDLRSVIDPNKP